MSEKVHLDTEASGKSYVNERSKATTICRVVKIITPYLRLMLDEGDADRSRQAFLVAVARERKWQQALDSGTVQDARQIGAMIGRDSSYVNRIIRLSMLAPQIIERVIKGEMPVTLSANRARQALPELWSEQIHEFFRD